VATAASSPLRSCSWPWANSHHASALSSDGEELLTVAVGVAAAPLLAGVLGRFTVPPAAAGVAPGVGVLLLVGVDEDL